jgi:hypothetical protein
MKKPPDHRHSSRDALQYGGKGERSPPHHIPIMSVPAMSIVSNSTDSSKASGRSISYDRLTNKWDGYCWDRITCLFVIRYEVAENMTEAEARAWLAE